MGRRHDPNRGRSDAATTFGAWLALVVLVAAPAWGQDGGTGPIGGIPAGPARPLLEPDPAAPPAAQFVEKLVGTTGVFEVKLGQGRFLTLDQPVAADAAGPADQPPQFLAVGDPNVADFFQITPRQIRVVGKKLGTTDLMVTNREGKTFEFEVRVVADLDVLREQLRALFPDASLKLAQLREKIVVEGEARDAAQVGRIINTIETYALSVQTIRVQGQVNNFQAGNNAIPAAPADPGLPGSPFPGIGGGTFQGAPGLGGSLPTGGDATSQTRAGEITLGKYVNNTIQVINLIRVPSSQQVLLKVRVAELNRSGFREIGADLLAAIPEFGTLFGTQIINPATGTGFAAGRVGASTFNGDIRSLNIGTEGTVYGTFSRGQFNAVLTALRRNSLLKILAEPNLVALNGHQANFLAGGEFPVPSFSGIGAGAPGGGGASSTQFKEFGVRLSFLPIVLDGNTIRLTVDPEVSAVDFSVATTLVPGGSPVPGLTKRSSHTTVELKQGETLAIAGLMQLSLDGATQKLPGLGDLPYIGGFFSNTTSNRLEKELIVLVTPYLIEPMAPGQVPPTPGDEVTQPNDLEFYFLNRIEGRTGIDGRSTTSYDDPLHLIRHSLVERKYLLGPSGFSK
ncbi:type II and III secretion system protein family protein [Tundrisphaera sp. TA3]|uniref:type II and III secretion system protein family protein n=1 Tax=Tundrisphaera sp. TA3 TaxID=3435775 RepID=UPI003EBDB0C6